MLCLIVTTFGVSITATLKLDLTRVRFDGRDAGWIRFTQHETELPSWLARLTFDQSQQVSDRWLFPGKWASAHRSTNSLARYLGKYGVTLRELQVAARFQLASAMNTSMLSDTIGLKPATIINYRQLSGGWWSDAIIGDDDELWGVWLRSGPKSHL